MVKSSRRFWHTSSLLILTVAVAATIAAVGVLFAAAAEIEANTPPQAKRFLHGLAVAAGLLLVLAMFCVGMLLIRYLAFRSARPTGKRQPTEYVNAWELAGQRMAVPPDEDEDEEQADP